MVGDDVHHAAQGIRAEAHGHHAAIDFDALGKVDRQVVQVKGRARAFLRNPVDEHFHVAARETVEHELHVGPHATRLAQLDAGHRGEGFRQVFVQAGHAFQVDGHGVEGRAVDAGHVAGFHFHFGQFNVLGAHFDVEFVAFARFERDGVFHGGIAHGFEHQGVCARRHPQVVNAFFVRACACGSAFDLYGGEVHDFMVRGDDFS